MKPVKIITAIALFTLSCAVYAEGKIISTYYESWKENTPGWKHYTNSRGSIGNKDNYEELTYQKKDKHWYWGRNSYVDKSGQIKGGTRDNIVPENGRYAISAYTFQKAYSGNVWLTNGNIQRRGGNSVILKIYLNDVLKKEYKVIKKHFKPLLFQYNFGPVKKDDTIYVAVCSAGNKKASYRLYYTIEEFAQGERPGKPVNIVHPAATEAMPQVEPNGRMGKRYRRIHQRQCADALKNKPELILLGDSITMRWPPEMMNRDLGKFKPANFGYGGDWTQNVLWRVQNGIIDKVKPKIAVLLIGTNNISNKYTNKEIVEGTKAIIAEINKKSPKAKIVLMGIFPRGKSIRNNRYYERIKIINKSLEKLCDNKKLFYLDIGSKLVEPDGSITREMMRDGLHIGPKGFEIWGAALKPLLEKINEQDKK